MNDSGKKRLLLADDEPSIRRVLGIALEDRGYEVLTAQEGLGAYQAFQTELPQIVLADIKMPGLDGIELLKRIKRDRPETEVIMITGHGDMELAIQSLKHEACDFVTKPVDDDILDIALKRAEEKIALREALHSYTSNLEEMVREKSARLIQAERAAAACQVMDRFFSAVNSIADGDGGGELAFFSEMPCYVSLHSPDLEIIYTNRMFEECFGNLLNAASWTIYGKRVTGDTDCPVRRTFESGAAQRSRELVRTRRDELVPVEVHTAPLPGGEQCEDMVLELCVDLSRIEELRSTLAETQQRYQQLFDEVPCYISVQDPDLKIRAANKRFKEDFGEPAAGHCYKVYKHRESPCPDCPVLVTFEDGRSRQCETAVMTKEGANRNVLISTSPLRDAHGRIDQVMEVSTDITRIRELQDRLASLGLLLGTVSHEMKNLLTLLDGGIYKVDSGLCKGDQERVREGWGSVRHMLARIKKMVLDILLYAKQRELEKAPVSAVELAEEAASHIRPRLEDDGSALKLSLDESAGDVLVDRDKIHSALTNVLENAADACSASDSAGEPTVWLSVFRRDHGQIVFEVADNGVGLDRESRERLFTLFYSSKGRRGTGLGLYVTKQIVDQHGGSIEVDSSPERGSVFRIVLPERSEAD